MGAQSIGPVSADCDPGELIDRAVAVFDSEPELFPGLIRQLHARTDRAAFDAAVAAASAPEIRRRSVGLTVLGQIGHTADRPYRDETLAVVLAEAMRADDDEVVAAAVAALGHLGDSRGLPGVLAHAGHPNDEVRLYVATALPACVDLEAAADAEAGAAIRTMIRLTQDADAEVRDWATFGLGSQLSADTATIRAALADRLDDPEGDIAGEAVLGLALRHDPRALPRVLTWLEDEPGNLIVEAALELAHADALPALLRLKAEGWGSDSADSALLEAAVAACTPPGSETA